VAVVAGLVHGLAVATPVADEHVAAERTGAARQEALQDARTVRVDAVAGFERVGVTPQRVRHGRALA